MEQKKQIAILGSTGSIGTQALEVIEEHSDLYEVYCLTANNKVELLAEQAHKFKPAAIVIANEQRYDELKALTPKTVSLTEFNKGDREILSNLEISLEQFK